MTSPLKIVVSMVVRDEEHRYQPRLCESLLSVADEIRVLDDCSKDHTAELIDRLDPRVRVKKILGGSLWDLWGEGIARQHALDWAMEAKGTHIIHVDGDEFIPHGRLLRDTIRANPDCDVFALTMHEVWQTNTVPWKIRVDGEWGPRNVPICWRVPPESQRSGVLPDGWEINPARLASGREPEVVAALAGFGDCLNTGVAVLHLGWADPMTRRKRYQKYLDEDGGQYHDLTHLESILQPPTLQECLAYPEVLPDPLSR